MGVTVSAPGRTEIGGNHTDHQRGSALAAAVGIDVRCDAAPNGGDVINLVSEGHGSCAVDLREPGPRPDERGRSAALIRGVAAWFARSGYQIGGFDARVSSRVPEGAGLSSSAAFEVAVGGVLSHLFNGGRVRPEHLALAGQYAENVYFGKPSGLMDQMASAVGGCVLMDFADPEKPVLTPVAFDPGKHGYALCVTDTKSSHAGLTAHYAAITGEMRAVAEYFGVKYLSEVDAAAFNAEIPRLRAVTGDRAVLRAMHFFGEDARVKKQAAALSRGDMDEFLKLVNESGRSSAMLLQNIYAGPGEQGVALALALSGRALAGTYGARRVHGGGFAGAVQAYVPCDLLPRYRDAIDAVFGAGSCLELRVRKEGCVAAEIKG